jgi:predicted acyl esterase
MDPKQPTADIAAAIQRGKSKRSTVGLLLSHGYIFVRAEARGTGASFGVRNGDMSGIEARDGRDIIDWIARQPWSTGKVAMIGGSYEGMSQLLVASSDPKPLTAIFPIHATFDEYQASWSGTGVLRKFGLAWLAREAKRDGVQQGKAGSVINPDDANVAQVPPVDDDPSGVQRAAARKERLGDPDAVDPMTYFTRQTPAARTMVDLIAKALGSSSPPDIMEVLYSPKRLEELMVANPNLRSQLSALRFTRDASAMLMQPQESGPNNLAALAPRIRASGVAVYNWGGWRDFATIDTLLWDANLSHPKKLTMGPWTHGPNEPDDLREAASIALAPIEQLRWLDYWLKGIDNGIMREPSVNYAVLGAQDRFSWHRIPAWPPLHKATPWSLTAGGELARSAARPGQLTFTVDYNSTMGDHTRYHDAIGLGPTRLPDLRRHAQEGALAFTSQPLSAPVTLVGSAVVELQVTASTSDADVHAYLERVERDGTVVMLADGVLRASHRSLGKPWYNNLGLPFSDSRSKVVASTPPLSIRTPSRLRFALQPIAAHFEKGSRIRLVVSGAEAGTNLTIQQDPATRLTLHLDRRAGSKLELPVAPF